MKNKQKNNKTENNKNSEFIFQIPQEHLNFSWYKNILT